LNKIICTSSNRRRSDAKEVVLSYMDYRRFACIAYADGMLLDGVGYEEEEREETSLPYGLRPKLAWVR